MKKKTEDCLFFLEDWFDEDKSSRALAYDRFVEVRKSIKEANEAYRQRQHQRQLMQAQQSNAECWQKKDAYDKEYREREARDRDRVWKWSLASKTETPRRIYSEDPEYDSLKGPRYCWSKGFIIQIKE